MSRHNKKFLFWIAIPVVVAGVLLFFLTRYLFDPDLYRSLVQKSLASQLGREVAFGKTKVSFRGGIGIAFDDFRIKDRSQSLDLLQSKRLILTAETLPLLRREIRWKRITLEKPILRLSRDRNGRLNVFNIPIHEEELTSAQPFEIETERKVIEALSTLFGGSLSIRSGEVSFSDESFGGPPLVTEIRSFDLHVSKISFDHPFPFEVSGKVHHGKKEGSFSISGAVEDIPRELGLSGGRVKADIELKDISIDHFWSYLKPLLPMERIAGILHLKGRYQGDLSGPFEASARIRFKEVLYDHPKVFAYLFTPPWINLDVEAKFDGNTFDVPGFSIDLPEIKVKGKGRIYGIGTAGMGLDAEASSGPFDIANGRRFIPFRIITQSVSDPLFRAEGSGTAQILSVRLSGKIPEIDHCDRLENAQTLSVEMKVNGARLKLPWNLPPLEELKGHLLFKQGHLLLKEVEGKVFHSSIDRAHGTFYELLQVPTLEIYGQGRFHVADLSALLKTDVFAEDTETTEAIGPLTSISGKAHYQLSVKGKLKSPLRFQHQGSYHLSNIHLIHPRVPFPVSIGEGRVDLANEQVQWSGAKVEIANSALLLSGFWRKGGASELIASGKIDLTNFLPLIQSSLFPKEALQKTEEIKSLSGTGQLSFKGRWAPSHPSFLYELEFIPKEASLLFKGPLPRLLFREGSFSLSSLGITLSKLKVQSLNSSLTLDGTIRHGAWTLSTSGSVDMKNIPALLQFPVFPEAIRTQADQIKDPVGMAEIRLNLSGRMEEGIHVVREGEVRLKGISLRHRQIPVPVSQVDGRILFSPHQVRFEGLKGKMGESSLTLSGLSSRPAIALHKRDVPPARQLSFSLSSSYLDLDSLLPGKEEKAPVSFEGFRTWLSGWASIEGKVHVEQGKVRNLLYHDLRLETKMVDGKLYIHPFQLEANGGTLWGEGWIQPSNKAIRFEIKPRLSHMEVGPFLRTVLRKEAEENVMVNGRVYIDQVELKGEGENFLQVKESLEGGLRLELENGVIERGNILAKIFSILNVSQILKGRLPDLRTRGLPYQRISATIQIHGGIALTEDFLVDSDSMRITAVGKADLGRNLIDAKVGVHPLVTVDSVLSNIPIAGYILTGKERAFLSYVYEVKGDLDDPKVEAVPFKAVGEGLVGIFKRLLETPLRPFRKNPSSK